MFCAVRLLGLNLSGRPPRICRAHAARAPSGTEHPPRTSAPRPCAEGGRARLPVLAAPFDAAWWQQRSAARADLACWRGPTRAPKAPGSVRRRRNAWRGWGSARAGGGAWPPTSPPSLTVVTIPPSPLRAPGARTSAKTQRAVVLCACEYVWCSADSCAPRRGHDILGRGHIRRRISNE